MLRTRPPVLQLNFDAQLVAGHHRPAEFRPLDPGEHDEFVLPVFHFGQQQRPARLGNGLHNQHPRHDRQVGKVPGKERLVDGHILDGHDPLLALDLNDAVDQQEGKAVGQNMENVDDVQRGLYRRRGCGRMGERCRSFSLVRLLLVRSEDYTVPRLSARNTARITRRLGSPFRTR